MNNLTVIGLLLVAGTIIVDRFLVRIPNRLAVILYGIALLCMVVGIFIHRRQAS